MFAPAIIFILVECLKVRPEPAPEERLSRSGRLLAFPYNIRPDFIDTPANLAVAASCEEKSFITSVPGSIRI